MFKFVHCADLHLDSPLRGLSQRDDAPVEAIRSATRRALENLVDLSLQEQARFVVISGDVYDGDWQDYNTGLFFSRCMARLNDVGIPVYLISGNHDAASSITRMLVLPPNVTSFSVDHAESYTIEDLRVAIHGQGFAQREVRENLALNYPEPLPGYLNIGLLHSSVQGQEGHESYAPCRLDELVQKGYDYWALGHIHQRQVLNAEPYIVYPGNIQGRHIRETGNKGCTLVTIDHGRVQHVEHRDLDVIRWATVAVDLTDAKSEGELVTAVADAIGAQADEHPGRLLAARILLTGRTALHGWMAADVERVRVEIDNAVNMVSADGVWIEKVKIQTKGVGQLEASATGVDALSTLRQTLVSVAEDDAFLEDFLSDMKAIQSRMPAYARHSDATVLDSIDDVRRLFGDAESLLAERLERGGVEE